MKEDDKLYNFSNLRNFLVKNGIHVEKGVPFKSVHIEKVNLKDLKSSNVIFDDEGYFCYEDPETKERQRVFMYKKAFAFYDNKKPKFHLFKCDAINTWGADEYDVANQGTVDVRHKHTGDIIKVSGLELCGYCRNILLSKNAPKVPETSEEMEQMLREEAKKSEVDEEVDIFGYVKNWETISRLYRKKMEYTCEECGIQMQGRNKRFIQVHHINGDKLNNREENLRCLCVYCHSKVNKHHKERFSSGDNLRLLKEFLKKYWRYFGLNGPDDMEDGAGVLV